MKKLHFFIMFFGLVTMLSMLFTSVPLPMVSIAQGPGGSCGEGKVLDCDLNCVSETIINDAWSNYYCNEFLNCPEFSYDGGDCGPAIPGLSCGDGYTVYDCNLDCRDEGIMEYLLHNGVCDEYLNCPELDNDGGDCKIPGDPCGSGKVLDCDLNCVDASTAAAWTGDGWCDDGAWGMNLVCEAFSFDEGDCTEPGNPCGFGKVLDCDLNCVDASTAAAWTGDGWCDNGTWGMNLVCEAFSFDEGDCNPAAPINLMILMTP